MYTQCPHCQTCFRIAEAHLKIANGRVRCGSCQEVFDATQRLFKNLTDREPISYPLPTTTPAPVTQAPAPAPREHKQVSPPAGRTEQIDLSRATTPSPKAVEKILSERQKAPDQAKFMESVIDNDRYNNLDKMNTIDIPGDIDFGDSIIKFAEDNHEAETVKPATESQPVQTARNAYEDIEAKEAPATQAEQETLENFFAEVDAQLHDDESKSQLDRDIDELLAFAKGLDQEHGAGTTEAAEVTQSVFTADAHGIEVSEEFDLQAIAEFEKELDATSTGVFSMKQPAQQQPIHETPESEEVEPSANEKIPPGHKQAATPEITPAENDSASIVESEPAAEMEIAATLPPHEEEIPRALRHSLEMLDQKPRRSLGLSLLMVLLILLLLGGLGFQIVLFRNVELAHQFPNLIPKLTEICDRIPCRYSGKVDVSQIKLINRDVRSDPNQPNALLISATFVDQAPFDQPYPIIQITLYDLGGNVVASRRFTPKEYLQKMYNRFLLMESGTPVHITLAVLDPGKDAINFEFSFL